MNVTDKQEYLPAEMNERLLTLMKEKHCSRKMLAAFLDRNEATISRVMNGSASLSHEQIIVVAKYFDVSTDFLLGQTEERDRKNYDIEELGLSVLAAKNLHTGKVNTAAVNRLLESEQFCSVINQIGHYFDDTFGIGYATQNQYMDELQNFILENCPREQAIPAAQDISNAKLKMYEKELDRIQKNFMTALVDIKDNLGYEKVNASRTMTSTIMRKMFAMYQKNQDRKRLQTTPDEIGNIMTNYLASTLQMKRAIFLPLKSAFVALLRVISKAPADQTNKVSTHEK